MDEAVVRCLNVGNKWSAAMMLTYWAPIPLNQGSYARAAQLAQQALALAREIHDRIGVYSALYTLADCTGRGRLFGSNTVVWGSTGAGKGIR
jgi:hypothetical protein